MPPRPIASPTDIPEAIAILDGRCSCPMTVVTLNVLTITAPARHTATAPTAPPTSAKTATRPAEHEARDEHGLLAVAVSEYIHSAVPPSRFGHGTEQSRD